ncbi:Uncharacterized protein dnl_63150 [Desulfonema limicola]|uniref:Uncharacterized protein n=1 Tax=Desulfonema limicola TaxID=45656 RepID=A0A975GJR9_9BACT|nr:hypothetical protein [Desulfonema limicola]QTA83891.1 Uncharacterized protein dnl_63150 [Desulfonema limicola]
MMAITRDEAIGMLNVVAEWEGFKNANIKFITRYGNELISVQPNHDVFQGRVEFSADHRRKAAWKAANWLSDLGKQTRQKQAKVV